jgi:acetyl-CoA carboxylase carboxyl transferase subunit beta
MRLISKDLFRKPNNRLEGEQEHPAAAVAPETDVKTAECPECKTANAVTQLPATDFICPRCGAQYPMSARARVNWLADEGSFQELDAGLLPMDRLKFPAYAEKLRRAQKDSGEPEGVVTGLATVGGEPCALFSMNPGFIMGSMGAVVGEKITRLFEYATEKRLPVIGYTVSGGARIQEGMFSLMQMAKTSGAVLRHGEAGLFYAAVLTNPTTGGVVASFAMEADVIIAEPKALIGFAGPRVIEQTMRQKLPEGFQRAEFLLKKGFVDRIVERGAQKRELSLLLAMHRGVESL